MARTPSVTSDDSPDSLPLAQLSLCSCGLKTFGLQARPVGPRRSTEATWDGPTTSPSPGRVRTSPATWPQQHRSAGSCVPGPWTCPECGELPQAAWPAFWGWGGILPPQPSPPGFPKVVPSQNSCVGSPKPST